MTFAQGASLFLLAAALVGAIWQRVNIGVLALAAAFPVLALSGLDPKKMYETFPGDLFVLIVGVSLLFVHLERSGALKWIVEKIFGIVGERTALLPWAAFVLAGALTSAGAFSTAVIAFLVPMIAYVMVRYRDRFLHCELAVVIAANCGGLSPLNPTGTLVRETADKVGVHYSTWGLWAASMVVAVVVVLALQGLDAIRRRRGRAPWATPAATVESETPTEKTSLAYQWSAGLAMIAFLVAVVGFKTDVGVTAVFLVAVLQLVFRPAEKALLTRVPWSSVLLLCGLLTYLGVMKAIGTMTSIQHGLDHIDSRWLLILVMAYMTALLCNIESSTLGVLGLITPLLFDAFGTSTQTFWVVVAVAVPAALMVMNPIHVAGTLIIGSSAEQDRDRLFPKLLTIAGSLAVITPGLLAIVPIAIG
ncbi:SLC13 family permease [Antrihabitans cavernicola]|uniref:C4-dicarboxylate ABC transporter n=1 Tax=Antrihabitans cavernicola TaxID=2495913 RepID=A0A5A7S9A4_9NOCA|nr:SLC13 family permease [Spelaeibacter cavernicola]KAA0021732.1 C4-dicarboxylate ABC transporter [Spelaeibacter cavernicola]